MEAMSPVIPGINRDKEVQFGGPGAGQPEYYPVPALVKRAPSQTYVACRYKFSSEEREWIASGADLFLTFLGGMPPHIVQVAKADPDDPNYSAAALADAVRVKELA